MLTDRLTQALEDAVSIQPFVPGLEPVFHRARRLRIRRRIGQAVAAATAVAVVALGTHSVLGTTQSLHRVPAGPTPSPQIHSEPGTDPTIELRPQTEPFHPMPITVGWTPFMTPTHVISGSTMTVPGNTDTWREGDIQLTVEVSDENYGMPQAPKLGSLRIDGSPVYGRIQLTGDPMIAELSWLYRPYEWIDISLVLVPGQVATRTLAPIGITSQATAMRTLKRIAQSIRDVPDPTPFPFTLALRPRGAELVCWGAASMELATPETLSLVSSADDPCTSSDGVVIAVLDPTKEADPFVSVDQGTDVLLPDGRPAIVATTGSVRRLQIGGLRINVPRTWPMNTLLRFAAGVRYTSDSAIQLQP